MSSQSRRWLAFVLWAIVIFTLVPFAPRLQVWIAEHFGEQAIIYALFAVLVTAVAAVVRWVVASRRDRPARSLVWILGIAALTGSWLWALREEAEPAHFFSFAVLGVLAFRALHGRLRDQGVYLAATALVAIVGTVDEVFQWLTPGRYWDLFDITINASVGALVQLFIWKGIRPASVEPGFSRRSLRASARLLAVAVVLLLLSLANTPGRIASYADRVPGLDYLGKQRSTRMIEYGHLYVDSEIGRFVSRLAPEELARIDRERGAEAGAILRKHRRPERHRALKQAYPPWRDPFVFEAREHLFYRRLYRGRMGKNRDDPEARKRLATDAYRENLILERYFGAALESSGLALKPARRQQLQELQQPDAEFSSTVANWLVTGFSEAQGRWLLLAALAALAVSELWSRHKDSNAE